MEEFKSEDIICEFTNKLLEDGDIVVDEYCKKYPSLKDDFMKRYQAMKFIEESLKEESWPGRKIGEYIIVEEIGRGGMGIVFLAIQQPLNRYVALKILPSGLTFDSNAVKHFQNEAKILARFNHPNIAPVFSSGEEEGIYYIAMAFISGLSLNKIIDSIKNLPEPEIKTSAIREIILRHPDFVRFNFDSEKSMVQDSITPKRDSTFWQKPYLDFIATIFQEVAEALSYAHNNKVYHGDLKPSNIILTPEGIPMVVDFGLAKDIKAITTMQSREFAGTIAYSSPEQIKNNAIDEKTDIWSLGVSLYESIALNHPFHGMTVSETLNKILNSEPPFLRKFNKKLPKDIEAIIFKCLEKNPSRRYPNILRLREDLKNFLELKPIKARPVGAMRRFYKCIKRHPLISLLTFGLISTIIVTSALLLNKKITDYINNGDIDCQQGKFDNALFNYDRGLRLVKVIPFTKFYQKEIFSGIGDALSGKGGTYQAYQNAISYYKKAVEIDPRYIRAITGLSDTYYEIGSYDESIKFAKLAINLAPNDRYNYYKLGQALAMKGLFDEAIKNYRIAIKLSPNDVDTLNEIISTLNKKGLYKDDEIKEYLEKSGFSKKQIDALSLLLNKPSHLQKQEQSP